MMNRLRNSASPASTWFGGIVGRPSALRVSDSTTIILVKRCTAGAAPGATDSTVSSRMMLTVWLGLPTPGSRLTETLPELVAARAAGTVAVERVVVPASGCGAAVSGERTRARRARRATGPPDPA